jgi:oligopeptidase B
MESSFKNSLFSYADRGFVYAVAHIRGGGDCGQAWYENGKFKYKRNTFTDFINSAKALVVGLNTEL